MKLPNIFEKEADLKTFRAGEIIFTTGQPADALYAVKEGQVDLLIGDRVIETVGPEGFFGELALLDAEPRSATARAKTDCKLAAINEKQFLFMVGETPFFALMIMRAMAQRLRRSRP
jgi:CRP/FNR family cyclic AMP-dependent transcriptional regulator